MPHNFRFNLSLRNSPEERVKLLTSNEAHGAPPPRPGRDLNAHSAGRLCCCVLIAAALLVVGVAVAAVLSKGASGARGANFTVPFAGKGPLKVAPKPSPKTAQRARARAPPPRRARPQPAQSVPTPAAPA